MSNMSGLLGFIIFIVICVLSSAANKKKSGGAKNTAGKTPAPKPAPMPKSMPKMPSFNAPKKPAAPAGRAEPERKYYDSTCMEADSKHDHDRRLEQLDNFLKSGIIDKEEYKILLEKYQR